jgi:hypothetical protein
VGGRYLVTVIDFETLEYRGTIDLPKEWDVTDTRLSKQDMAGIWLDPSAWFVIPDRKRMYYQDSFDCLRVSHGGDSLGLREGFWLDLDTMRVLSASHQALPHIPGTYTFIKQMDLIVYLFNRDVKGIEISSGKEINIASLPKEYKHFVFGLNGVGTLTASKDGKKVYSTAKTCDRDREVIVQINIRDRTIEELATVPVTGDIAIAADGSMAVVNKFFYLDERDPLRPNIWHKSRKYMGDLTIIRIDSGMTHDLSLSDVVDLDKWQFFKTPLIAGNVIAYPLIPKRPTGTTNFLSQPWSIPASLLVIIDPRTGKISNQIDLPPGGLVGLVVASTSGEDESLNQPRPVESSEFQQPANNWVWLVVGISLIGVAVGMVVVLCLRRLRTT